MPRDPLSRAPPARRAHPDGDDFPPWVKWALVALVVVTFSVLAWAVATRPGTQRSLLERGRLTSGVSVSAPGVPGVYHGPASTNGSMLAAVAQAAAPDPTLFVAVQTLTPPADYVPSRGQFATQSWVHPAGYVAILTGTSYLTFYRVARTDGSVEQIGATFQLDFPVITGAFAPMLNTPEEVYYFTIAGPAPVDNSRNTRGVPTALYLWACDTRASSSSRFVWYLVRSPAVVNGRALPTPPDAWLAHPQRPLPANDTQLWPVVVQGDANGAFGLCVRWSANDLGVGTGLSLYVSASYSGYTQFPGNSVFWYALLDNEVSPALALIQEITDDWMYRLKADNQPAPETFANNVLGWGSYFSITDGYGSDSVLTICNPTDQCATGLNGESGSARGLAQVFTLERVPRTAGAWRWTMSVPFVRQRYWAYARGSATDTATGFGYSAWVANGRVWIGERTGRRWWNFPLPLPSQNDLALPMMKNEFRVDGSTTTASPPPPVLAGCTPPVAPLTVTPSTDDPSYTRWRRDIFPIGPTWGVFVNRASHAWQVVRWRSTEGGGSQTDCPTVTQLIGAVPSWGSFNRAANTYGPAVGPGQSPGHLISYDGATEALFYNDPNAGYGQLVVYARARQL